MENRECFEGGQNEEEEKGRWNRESSCLASPFGVTDRESKLTSPFSIAPFHFIVQPPTPGPSKEQQNHLRFSP